LWLQVRLMAKPKASTLKLRKGDSERPNQQPLALSSDRFQGGIASGEADRQQRTAIFGRGSGAI